MPRDDFDRRRLRSLYERNRSRVSALADARDRRRGGDDSYAAPHHYVVSERRTRVEGFGRGGAQVRRVERRIVRVRDAVPSRRFSDRGIFRRGGRDRFRRADDLEREERRDRFRNDRNRYEGGERRIGEARRSRLRMRSRRGGAARREGVAREIEDRRQRGSRRGGEGRHNNNNNGGNSNNRGGNNGKKNSSNRVSNNRGGNKNNQSRRPREQPLTREQLDQQLENYHN